MKDFKQLIGQCIANNDLRKKILDHFQKDLIDWEFTDTGITIEDLVNAEETVIKEGETPKDIVEIKKTKTSKK